MIQSRDHCTKCGLGVGYRWYIDKSGNRFRRYECSECGTATLRPSAECVEQLQKWINEAEKVHAASMVRLRGELDWLNGKDVPLPYDIQPLHEGDNIPDLPKSSFEIRRSDR